MIYFYFVLFLCPYWQQECSPQLVSYHSACEAASFYAAADNARLIEVQCHEYGGGCRERILEEKHAD